MMFDFGYFVLFFVGLLGGIYCVGMCGGIVGVLLMGVLVCWFMFFVYNVGCIVLYVIVGVIVGVLGVVSLGFEGQILVWLIFYFFVNLMLVVFGFYLFGVIWVLVFIEWVGQYFWWCIQLFIWCFLLVWSLIQVFLFGLFWGWLFCGLVYSVLVSLLIVGLSGCGVLLMLVFGLGILLNFLLVGILFVRLNEFVCCLVVCMFFGLLVFGFGFYGLFGLMCLLGWIQDRSDDENFVVG